MQILTIRGRILASFGAILLVMLAVGGFTYASVARIDREAHAVESSVLPGLHASAMLRKALADQYATTIRMLYGANEETDAALLGALRQTDLDIDRGLTEYEGAIRPGDDHQAFDKAHRALDDYRRARTAIMQAPATAGHGMAIRRDLDPLTLRADLALDALARDSNSRGHTAAAEMGNETDALESGVIVSFLAALLAAVFGGVYLLRAITRPLARLTMLMDVMRGGDFTQRMEVGRRDEFGELGEGFNRMADEVMSLVGQVQKSGIRVSTSMTEIAATSKQQQATASEVAATTTEIGATSREISATSRELVRTMGEVSNVAEQAADLASSGQTGLAHMEKTMGQVMEAAGSINAKLAVLNEKAGNINQVVTTITKVADQTNLLSLNAAIEAEKAGEYGRGFAVVSSEIRRLADQTAVATYDIEQMVKDIQAAVSAGVMGMDKFSEEVRRGMHDIHEIGGKLSEIISQVQALVPRFETVNDGMRAQATGAEQISEALLQLTETTQQTVESLRQSSSAIDELNQVSGSLHGSISRFKLAAA